MTVETITFEGVTYSKEVAHVVEPLRGCARCGNEHPRVEFYELAEPITIPRRPAGEALTHWGVCPVKGEPILLRFVEAKQA